MTRVSLAILISTLVAHAQTPERFSGVPRIPDATGAETELSQRFHRSAMLQARHVRGLLEPWPEHPECLALAWISTEHGIRPNTHTASGLAVLSRLGTLDPAIIGATRETVQSEVIAILRRVTSTHLTGPYVCEDGKHWGDQWQSALWAAQAGWAAWVLWDRLDPALQEAVGRVVEHEADRFIKEPPPAQVAIDTKAEENAWNAMCISLAANMFPKHPHHRVWLRTGELYSLSSFLRVEDFAPGALAQYGDLARDLSGPNIHADYTLENHARVHPDYMSTPSILNNQMFYYHAAGRPLPAAIRHNQAGIWAVLEYLSLDCAAYFYANGQDWELHREPEWGHVWTLASLLLDDPDAARLAECALEKTERMQARGDGAAYLPGEWFFPSTQQFTMESQALAWLALRWFGPGPEPSSLETYDRGHSGLRLFDTGKFMCLRTPKMMASFSWGAQTMGLIALRGKDFLTSPDMHGFVGEVQTSRGRVKDVAVRSQIISTNGTPCVRLVLDRAGGAVRQQLAAYFVEPDTMVYLSTLIARRNVTIDAWSLGTIGILNDPNHVYQPGFRMFEHAGGRLRVESAGEKEEVRPLAGPWVNVDRRLRIDFAGDGEAWLLDRAEMTRGRLTELLIPAGSRERKSYRAGQRIARLGMVVRAGCDSIEPAPLQLQDDRDGGLALTWQGRAYRLR